MTERWIDGGLGMWILLSPWLLGFADVSLAKWSCVLVGLVLVILNAWALFAERPGQPGSDASSEHQK